MGEMQIPPGQSSTGQTFGAVEGEKNSQSTDSSGRKTSIGSDTRGAEKTSTFSSKIDKTPEESDSAIDLSGRVTKENATPTIQKVIQSVKIFFQPLIDKFKELKQHFTGQKNSQIPAEVKAESPEGKINNTLDKFGGKAENRQEFTLEDQKNLNKYFSGDNIDSGVDKLIDIFNNNPEDAFEVLETLSLKNKEKVESQLEEKIGIDFTIKKSESDGKIGNIQGRMEHAVTELKNSSDNGNIKQLIGNIRSQSDALCPKNASEEFKLNAEIEAKTSALKQLTEGSDGRAALQEDAESLVLKRAGIDSFDKLDQLYSDPAQIDKANQTIADLAKIDPDKAGKVLFKATKSLDTNKLEGIAKNVLNKIDSTEAQAGLVGGALKQEIKGHPKEDPGSLLRGNTVSSKVLAEFSNRHVLPHFGKSESLEAALANLPKENVVEMHEDGNKFISDENQQAIQDCVTNALQAIKEVAIDPDNNDLKFFYEMCKNVQATVKENFGEKSASVIPLNFLFLRGVNSQLVKTKSQGGSANKFEGQQQKNAILMSKVTQNMANKIPFGGLKEAHMEPFNSFFDSGSGPLEEIRQHMLS